MWIWIDETTEMTREQMDWLLKRYNFKEVNSLDFNTYQKAPPMTFKESALLTADEVQISNWALGIANEAGELAGEIKHVLYYQEPLDKMKVAKEVGDVLWYLSALCTSLGISLSDCAELNLAKLSHRHGDSFSFESSKQRHNKEEAFTDTAKYQELKRRIEG